MAHDPDDRASPVPADALTAEWWQARYDAGATGWDRGAASPVLTRWLADGSLSPCRILVPGCGRGHEVVALARHGYRVTAIDYAPAAVQAVRERLAAEGLRAEVIEADLLAYEPETAFDAIYEQTCLCALVPKQWHAYELRLASWLVPGGRLAAVFMQTDAPTGPPFACKPDAMRRLFSEERWEWPDSLEAVPHPTGLEERAGILHRRALCRGLGGRTTGE